MAGRFLTWPDPCPDAYPGMGTEGAGCAGASGTGREGPGTGVGRGACGPLPETVWGAPLSGVPHCRQKRILGALVAPHFTQLPPLLSGVVGAEPIGGRGDALPAAGTGETVGAAGNPPAPC